MSKNSHLDGIVAEGSEIVSSSMHLTWESSHSSSNKPALPTSRPEFLKVESKISQRMHTNSYGSRRFHSHFHYWEVKNVHTRGTQTEPPLPSTLISFLSI